MVLVGASLSKYTKHDGKLLRLDFHIITTMQEVKEIILLCFPVLFACFPVPVIVR